MGNFARTWAVLTLLAVVGSGCESPGTAVITLEPPAGMQVLGGELAVFDGAYCEGARAVGGQELDRISFQGSGQIALDVDAGYRSFEATIYDGDTEIARGCFDSEVVGGEAVALNMPIADTTCFGDAAGTVDFGTTYDGDTVDRTDYFRVFLKREFTPAIISVATEMPQGATNTRLSLRTRCGDPDSELSSVILPPFPSSFEVPVVDDGQYYLVVDSAKTPGLYELMVVLFVDRVF